MLADQSKQYSDAVKLCEENKYDEVYNSLKDEKDHPSSMYLIGMLIYDGKIKSIERSQCIEFLNLADELKYAPATIKLGDIYFEGFEGFPPDYVIASKYYLKYLNSIDGLETLNGSDYAVYYRAGKILVEGLDGTRNYQLGIAYLNFAHNHYAEATLLLADLYNKGIIQDIPRNQELAIRYLTEGANAPMECLECAFKLAMIYRERADAPHAIKYFELCHEKGMPLAAYYLGSLYTDYDGVRNVKLGLEYFQES